MSERERIPIAEPGAEQGPLASILLIDDDEQFRRFLAIFLRGKGFTVASANSGKEGIARALEFTPDLVICDLDMPGMNGYEVLARLRRDTNLGDIPVMFLTGQAAPEQIREGMDLGADDYLTKPLNSTELLRAVKARLARAQAGRAQQEKQIDRAMQMFAEVVHDLRDPLFVVFGYTNMLQKGGAPDASSGVRAEEILNRMQHAITRMQTIVSETLFLAKSKMQRLPFDPSPFDLRVLCEHTVADLAREDRLRFECNEPECDIVGDPLRLRQALENLLTNALKYSDKAVVVALSKQDSGYTVTVTDQGIGIPSAEHARVFDPFFRASNATGKPGHGLGLSIVKTCVEQHGGSVKLVSKPGKGTTFTVLLPFAPPAARLASASPHSSVPPLHLSEISLTNELLSEVAPADAATMAGRKAGELADKLSCIIVDDEPLVRSVLRDLLNRSGELNVVGEAGSVAQARQLIAKSAPDVVFLDINLPDAPGFELLSSIGPQTAVVFVTSAEEYAINAFDSDAVDYLLKPVSAERLQRTLKRIRLRAAGVKAEPVAVTDSRLGGDDTFLVKTMAEKKLIKVRDVKSIRAYGEYSWVYWDKGKGALMRKSLKQWEKELPGAQFVRIHRHAIINLAFIERVEKLSSGRQQVHLRDMAEPIAVSLRLASTFNRRLKSAKA